MSDKPKRSSRWGESLVHTRSLIPQWAVWTTVLAVLGIAALILTCIFVIPERIYPDLTEATLANVKDEKDRIQLREARSKLQNDARTTLVQGVGGLLVLLGASIGAAVSLRQVSLGREGQITERFTNAIDQLGSEKIEIRVGGIFALERIVKNSPPDRKPIGEVLNAFVNSRVPWKSENQQPDMEQQEQTELPYLPPGEMPYGEQTWKELPLKTSISEMLS